MSQLDQKDVALHDGAIDLHAAPESPHLCPFHLFHSCLVDPADQQNDLGLFVQMARSFWVVNGWDVFCTE